MVMESQQVLTDSVDAQKMERFLQELSKPSTSQEYLQSVIKQTRGLSETTELRNAFGQHALNSDDRIKIYKEIASRKDNTESVHGLLREASKSNEEKESLVSGIISL
jgi:hypothetical protein